MKNRKIFYNALFKLSIFQYQVRPGAIGGQGEKPGVKA
jgi:hypothetical protein